jgi:tetratricopeptide (TPR) repeat protein
MRRLSRVISAIVRCCTGSATDDVCVKDAEKYLNRGNEWLAMDCCSNAIDNYNRVVQIDPRCAKAYFNRGLAWFRAGDCDKAIEDYDRAVQIDPSYAKAYCYRGRTRRAMGNPDKAIADYDRATRIDPNDATAYGLRGVAWLQKRNYDKAIEDCNRVVQIEPCRASAYGVRALAWLEKGDYEKAIQDYDRVVQLDANDDAAYFGRGRAWSQKGNYARTIEDYKHALRLDPEDINYLDNLAWIQATCPDETCCDGKEALENAKQAHQLSGGKYRNCIDTLAAAYAECGDFEKAQEWAAKVVELAICDKDKADYLARLELYKQHKPYRDVRENQHSPWPRRANHWRCLEKYCDVPENQYSSSCQQTNEGHGASQTTRWLMRAISAMIRFSTGSAENDASLEDARYYFERGMLWGTRGDDEKAIEDYDRVVRIDPDFAAAYYNRGKACVRRGDYDKAITDFSQCVRLSPNDADNYHSRARVWAAKGDHDKAIEDYNRVIQIDPDDITAYHDRALAWLEKGDYDKAIEDGRDIRTDPRFNVFLKKAGLAGDNSSESEEKSEKPRGSL